MNHHIDLQVACSDPLPMTEEQLVSWVNMTLNEHKHPVELTLRIVDIQEITALNGTYRKQDKPTNVLAFPSNLPDSVELEFPLLGDVIICPAVLKSEAIEQDKPLDAHWAHIVIHGVLHLLGHDHYEEKETKLMQAEEIKLLTKLGFANPYHQEGNESE